MLIGELFDMIKEDNDKSRISDSLCAGCYLNTDSKIEYVVLFASLSHADYFEAAMVL